MKRKYTLIIMILVIILMVSAGCNFLSKKESAKTIVLKAAETHPEDYPSTLGTKYLAKLLEERSKGRIKLQVYAGGQLGDAPVVLAATREGVLDITRQSSATLNKEIPIIAALQMPYLFRDSEHLWKVLDGEIGQNLAKEFEKVDLIPLAYYDVGFRSFYTTSKVINSQSDLDGLKIRVMSSDIFITMIQLLGAQALPLDQGQVFAALQTKAVDGAENSPPSYFASKDYTLAPNYVLDEHVVIPEVVLMSRKTWETFSIDEQKLIKECSAEASQFQRKAWNEYSNHAMTELAAKGVIISKPDKSSFVKAVEPIYANYPQFQELIKQIQAVK